MPALGEVRGHRHLVGDVSLIEPDVPPIVGHGQVTDAQLLTLARRHSGRLATVDAGVAELAQGRDVEVLAA